MSWLIIHKPYGITYGSRFLLLWLITCTFVLHMFSRKRKSFGCTWEQHQALWFGFTNQNFGWFCRGCYVFWLVNLLSLVTILSRFLLTPKLRGIDQGKWTWLSRFETLITCGYVWMGNLIDLDESPSLFFGKSFSWERSRCSLVSKPPCDTNMRL